MKVLILKWLKCAVQSAKLLAVVNHPHIREIVHMADIQIFSFSFLCFSPHSSPLLLPPIPPPQVLARRLSPDSWDGESSVSVIPGADLRAVPGQVCGVRQDEWRYWGSATMLLHDRRQGGQDPRAAGELWGGGPEQGYWGGVVCSYGPQSRINRQMNESIICYWNTKQYQFHQHHPQNVFNLWYYIFGQWTLGSRGQAYPRGLLW